MNSEVMRIWSMFFMAALLWIIGWLCQEESVPTFEEFYPDIIPRILRLLRVSRSARAFPPSQGEKIHKKPTCGNNFLHEKMIFFLNQKSFYA